ncbi:hypothetical protein [Sphingomonas sp.]|uniref:hypothetical protein n=1 Tax=Sphingomonas sp. TaxID=28214 RepID=UPI0025DEEB59|nr:hypothetical protein [Sphingomonas sp.]
MAKYADARNREIDKYHRVARLYGVEKLDLLFLSHVHADHVNGVERLLGLQEVDTIVLPLLNVKDRLIAYGWTAVEDPASAQNGFYRDLIVDPASALSRFRPRQILFIEPGGEGGAPGGGEGPIEPSDGSRKDPFPKGADGEDGPSWFLVGRGHPRVMQMAADSWTGVTVIPDTMAMMATASVAVSSPASSSTWGAWLMAPYVDPMIASQRKRFISALAKELKMTAKLLEPLLTSTGYVTDLVIDKVDCLATAYAKLARDLNVTSMSLYSGPARSMVAGERRTLRGTIGGIGWHGGSGRIAWLATGDAALKHVARRKNFLAHYTGLLDQVATLTLPHHGSEHNFHVDLLKAVNPQLCVAAADSYSNWKHPESHVVQTVCSHPALMQVVTSKQPSRVWELASLS